MNKDGEWVGIFKSLVGWDVFGTQNSEISIPIFITKLRNFIKINLLNLAYLIKIMSHL